MTPSTKTSPMKQKKATKRVPTRVTYNVACVDDYMRYAKTLHTQALFFRLALEAVQYGVAENKDAVDLMTLPGRHNNTVMSIEKTQWKSVLQRAISFYSKNNEFERCIDCQQLLSVL